MHSHRKLMWYKTALWKWHIRNTTPPEPGARACSGLAHLCLIWKKPKKLVGWVGLWHVNNARSCIWQVQTNWWLWEIIPVRKNGRWYGGLTHQTALLVIVHGRRCSWLRCGWWYVICNNITLLNFTAFGTSIETLKLTIPTRCLISMLGLPQIVRILQSQKIK